MITDEYVCDTHVTVDLADTIEVSKRAGVDQSLMFAWVEFAVLIMSCVFQYASLDSKSFMGEKMCGAVILYTLTMIRIPSTGIMGCVHGDAHCCPNMECGLDSNTGTVTDDTYYVYTGCYDGIVINWFNPSNYCNVPEWYVQNIATCSPLENTFNSRHCYAWGCNKHANAYRSLTNRVWMGLLAVYLLDLSYRIRTQ